MYDDRRTVEPKESEVNEGNLNGEKTIEVGRKLENGKWIFDEVSVPPFCICIVLVEIIFLNTLYLSITCTIYLTGWSK